MREGSFVDCAVVLIDEVENRRTRVVVVAIVAVGWIVGIALADVELGSSVVLPSLLAVAPVIASLALAPLGTAAVAILALVAALFLGWPDHYMMTAQHEVAVATVLVVGAVAVWTAVLRRELETAKARAEVMASTDALTGVLNRRAFVTSSQAIVDLRTSPSRWVLMLDLDRFKSDNDRFGHLAGDRVLAAVAQRAASSLRQGDLIGRYGGDEFVVLYEGGPETDVSVAAERVLDAVRCEPVHTNAGDIAVTVSGGLSALDAAESEIWPAVARADEALYRSKAGGRNHLTVFFPQTV